MDLLWLLLSVSIAYGTALGTGLLVKRGNGFAIGAAACGVGVLFLCPLLIPLEHIWLRALTSLCGVELSFKIADFVRHCRENPEGTTSWSDYCRFLVPFPVGLVVFRDRQKPSEKPQRPTLARPLQAIVGLAAIVLLGKSDSITGAIQSSFVLDHFLKLVIFVLLLESMSRILHWFECFVGYDRPPPMQSIYRARTVAEFWWRYNTRIHDWLYYNVFRPSGGRRAPVRGVFLTFLVSAIFHELMFGIVTSRFDGYQFAFFMLQAPAFLASGRLEKIAKRPGRIGPIFAHTATIVWMSVTSVLFFHGVHRIFPFFYTSNQWLP